MYVCGKITLVSQMTVKCEGVEFVEDLKILIRVKKIPVYAIIGVLGISEATFYRWMRKYNPEHRAKILKAIELIEGAEKHD